METMQNHTSSKQTLLSAFGAGRLERNVLIRTLYAGIEVARSATALDSATQ